MEQFPLDLERFWENDTLAHAENCFSRTAPQVALGIRMSDECVFAELNEPGEPWGHTPRERRLELNRRYNDHAERIVGKRLLRETLPDPGRAFPAFRQIGEVFGGEYVFDGKTTWLRGTCSTPKELCALLDRIDRMDLRSFILPENWESEKRRIYEQYGIRPPLFRGIRGPVTLATSVFGYENLIFLIHDTPDLARRFSDTIARVILEYVRIFIEEAGQTPEHFTHGFQFNDDDSYLLTPQMYELFGFPILQKVFAFTAPDPGDFRYQHSDSPMGHLLPILARLNLTGCNFGPTLTVREIRSYMPHTRIDGQLAPFTFMSNDTDRIIAEVRRDCEMAKENNLRGVNISTAGSINNGSLLSSMRAVMYAVQTYGQYD